MSRAPLLCPACGAKNHAAWRLCQRCRGDLTASIAVNRVEPGAASEASPPSPPVVPWRSALSLVAVAAVAWFAVPDREAAQSPAVVRSAGFGPAPGTPSVRPTEEARPTPTTAFDGYADRRGIAAYRAGEMGEAINAFEEAVATNPQDAESLNNLAQVFVHRGRVPEAMALFDRAVALGPDKWAFRFNRARARGLMEDWEGAVQGYREAERLFPDDHVTLFNLGLALRRLDRHGEAVEVLERVVHQDESDPSFLLPLGQSYEALGRDADAVRVYQRYIETTPDGSDAGAVRARLDRLLGRTPTSSSPETATPEPGPAASGA